MPSSPAPDTAPDVLRFGIFELDTEAGQLYKNGRVFRLQPKPFKLLCLLAEKAGTLVTREDIQKALWSSDTFVDFEQGVNFPSSRSRTPSERTPSGRSIFKPFRAADTGS